MARSKRSEGLATRRDVQGAASTWSDVVLLCRTRGHRWEQRNAWHVKRYHYWHVLFDCERGCGVQKYEEWTEDGIIVGKSIRYPRDDNGNPLYLLEGVGRIDAEGRGVLRLEAVARQGFSEITTSEENEDTIPHSSATRVHLEGAGLWPSK